MDGLLRIENLGKTYGRLVAWLAWSFIHIFFLIGFRNRFRVMVEWIWYYITFKPGARLIYGKPRGLREEGAGEANGLP